MVVVVVERGGGGGGGGVRGHCTGHDGYSPMAILLNDIEHNVAIHYSVTLPCAGFMCVPMGMSRHGEVYQ